MADPIDESLAAHRDELIRFRRDLHAHPELSGQEHRTTGRIADRLSEAGLSPVVLEGGVGVVCDVGTGDGPVVGLRADIDALPLDDIKDVPYRSIHDGVCHACGHDVHTTIVLGAGLALHEMADEFRGRVRLIFQPSEEVVARGAHVVIGQGHLAGVGMIFGMHCDPKLLAGHIGLRVGPITSAADFLGVELLGEGGHTGRPHLTTDPVYAAARLITELPGAVSRMVDPRASLSVIFGQINGGTAANVIAKAVTVRGTVRTMSREVWGIAPEVIGTFVEKMMDSLGVECRVSYERGNPPVVNDPTATAVFAAAVREQLGTDGEAETGQSMGAEDFAWYLEKVPGAYARLGVGIPDHVCDIHSPNFDIDERAIGIGGRVLAQTAVGALEQLGADPAVAVAG